MTDPGTPDTDSNDIDDDVADDPVTPPADLKPQGQAAIDRMKARVKEANARAASAKQEAEELRRASAAIDPEAIEKRIRAQVASETIAERALDRLETEAAKMEIDTDVARAMLASRVGEFIEEGKVSKTAIAEALTKLVEDKPYLAARAGKRFAGSGDGGARGATPATSDMNQIIRRAAGHS